MEFAQLYISTKSKIYKIIEYFMEMITDYMYYISELNRKKKKKYFFNKINIVFKCSSWIHTKL